MHLLSRLQEEISRKERHARSRLESESALNQESRPEKSGSEGEWRKVLALQKVHADERQDPNSEGVRLHPLSQAEFFEAQVHDLYSDQAEQEEVK